MLFSVVSLLAVTSGFEYSSRYACIVCQDLRQDLRSLLAEEPAKDPCDRYGSCHAVNASSVADGCEKFCPKISMEDISLAAEGVDLRVAKGFGTKSYESVRISVITQDGSKPAIAGQPFGYSAPFKYKWTGNQLHSSVIELSPGAAKQINIAGENVSLNLPVQGGGVAGVLIADPCVKSSEVGCTFESRFQTTVRTPLLLNAFVGGSSETDFWGIFGDNFYDRQGAVTKSVYDQIDLKTKSKIMLTVAGNHDYWVLGAPEVGGKNDQYANGHMQWYAQDTKAANETHPFDFAVDPDTMFGTEKRKPSIANSFFYNQIGNLAIIGYSGAYHFTEAKPYLEEACQWLKGVQGVKVVAIVGHWDVSGLGCESDMAGPALYDEVKAMEGCDAFDTKGMLKFIMGHTHCNVPHPHGKVDAGFMVAGQGMEGCGNYGIPIIDTTENRIRLWNFEVVSKVKKDNYEQIMSCVQAKGWRGCTELAESWLDQPLA